MLIGGEGVHTCALWSPVGVSAHRVYEALAGVRLIPYIYSYDSKISHESCLYHLIVAPKQRVYDPGLVWPLAPSASRREQMLAPHRRDRLLLGHRFF